MTGTPVHPKEPDVLKLMGTTDAGEMLPSILARYLAPCLGTIQAQPISLGASSPSEGLTFAGQAQPIIPPLALKTTLTNPAGPLTKLQPLRDQTLNELYGIYKNSANAAQRDYIDSLVTSQAQVRNIRQDLLDQLTAITDNSITSQIQAAVALIQMKVTPVIASTSRSAATTIATSRWRPRRRRPSRAWPPSARSWRSSSRRACKIR
jgi:hypothetical protein